MKTREKVASVIMSPLDWWNRAFQPPTSQYYNSPVTVDGSTSPGFEAVKTAFRKNFDTGQERGSQLCVVWRGKRVVDLWGRQGHEYDYGADSLQICMSCTKVLTSICVAMAVDRGHFQFEDKVSKHWPEFGQNGKESTTIADVLRHDGGLMHFTFRPLTLEDIADYKLIARVIEEAPSDTEFNTTPVPTSRAYHSVTRGFILNALFRKTVGMTIGQFVRTEVVPKLKLSEDHGFGEVVDDSLFLGVTSAEYSRLTRTNRIAPLGVVSPYKLVGQVHTE